MLDLNRSTAAVDVQSPGRDSFRAELRGGTEPGSFTGLVMRWHAPVIIDNADQSTVILLEPPCGPDLPLVPRPVKLAPPADVSGEDRRTATGTGSVPSAYQMGDAACR
ncbi:hypothetical protein [Polymorphospora lycopeni]|uniref:Uncharacterized protein n=1 Tax=Polymorphospora lycopeni TaxID=3140240 RepID=A0ABV5CMT5_9ACTN